MRLLVIPSLFVIISLLGVPTNLLAQDREIKALASTLAESLASASKKTTAVVDFTDLQGNVTELGRFLAEELSVALASTDSGIEVIDRTHLNSPCLKTLSHKIVWA
jgi:hypothetical protein